MRSLILSLALAAVLPAAAAAQGIPVVAGTMEFAPVGGASIPFGDFGEFAEPGYGVGGTFSYYVMPNLAVGATGAYNSYGQDSDPDDTISMSIWEFTAHGKYLFIPGPVSPYGKASLGLYRSSVSVEGFDSVSSSDMGLAGGLGLQMRLPDSNLGIFGEGMINTVFTEDTSTNYYTLRVGLNFTRSIQ